MKINKIQLNHLRNSEHYGFFHDFKGLIEKYQANTLGVDEIFVLWLLLFASVNIPVKVRQ